VLKVSSMQLAKTGRPETVYKKATGEEQATDTNTEREKWTQTQPESIGTSMPLN
jgi:hypothetical protein